MKTKFLSLLLCVILVLAVCPAVFALKASSENIALGKPTKESSVYMGYDFYKASNVVDGNVISEWMSYIGATPEWFIIDLQQEYRIAKIRVAGRWNMLNTEGMRNFELQLSNDPNFYEYETVHVQGQEEFAYHTWLEVNVTSKQTYRYFRYMATMVDCRGIGEVEIYSSNAREPDPYAKYEQEDYLKGLKVLEQIGIVNLDNFVGESVITRAEAVRLLMQFRVGETTADTSSFVDVGLDNPYLGEIETAYQLGWLSMPEDGRFRPNEYISKNAFLKLLLHSIDYGALIEKHGEYPGSVNWLAKELRLMKNLSIEEDRVVLCGEMVIMMYNALCAPYLQPTVESDWVIYKESETVLEQRYGLAEYSGVVTANQYSDLSTGRPTGIGSVTIDGETYYDRNNTVQDYLGQTVDFFVDTISGDIVTAEPSKSNKVTEFSGKNISSDQKALNGGKITAEPEDGGKITVVLKKGFTVLHTGIADNTYTIDTFKSRYAQIAAIDNDNDGQVEVLCVKDYASTTVSSAHTDVTGVTTVQGDNGKTYRITAAKDYRCSVISESGTFEPTVIESGDVISISQSPDGRGTEVLISQSGEVNGVLEELIKAEDKISIGGMIYDLNKGYWEARNGGANSADTLTVGQSYRVVCNWFGEVVAMYMQQDDIYEYAYLINKDAGRGVCPEVLIKILSVSGNIKILPVADKVIVDGKQYSRNELSKKLKENSGLLPQDVVKIRINENRVREIDTAVWNLANGEDKHTLSKRVYQGDVRWSYWHEVLYIMEKHTMEARYDSNVPIFEVPVYTEADGSKTVAEDKEGLFKVTRDPKNIVSGSNEEVTGIIAGYDVNMTTKETKAFLRYVDAGGGGTLYDDASAMVVGRISNKLDENGDVRLCLVGYTSTGKTEFFLNEEMIPRDLGGKLPEGGDIYQYHANKDLGEIDMMRKVFDLSEDLNKLGSTGDALFYTLGIIGTSFSGNFRANLCVVLEKNKDLLSVVNGVPIGMTAEELFRRTDVFDLNKFRIYSYHQRTGVSVETASYLDGMVYEANPHARLMVINDRNGGNQMIVCYQLNE